eukprot:GHVQ01029593.1.p1 GENE.GHVQ01029593.1~~GHVQ01029593.1.p1  ORF type:complete len:311 (+),score=28.42 GHVQ01029593.1:1010-1942(+)
MLAAAADTGSFCGSCLRGETVEEEESNRLRHVRYGNCEGGSLCDNRSCTDPFNKRGILYCIKCRRGYHASCCDPPLRYDMVTRFAWSCNECQGCEVCRSNQDESSMLICDACDRAFHMQCMSPPLHQVPEGDWYCDSCGLCTCCNQRLSEQEVMSTVCFQTHRYRLCIRCKGKFDPSFLSEATNRAKNVPSSMHDSTPKPSMKNISKSFVRTGEAISTIGMVGALCAVCIKPLSIRERIKPGHGQRELILVKTCQDCGERVHPRCMNNTGEICKACQEIRDGFTGSSQQHHNRHYHMAYPQTIHRSHHIT